MELRLNVTLTAVLDQADRLDFAKRTNPDAVAPLTPEQTTLMFAEFYTKHLVTPLEDLLGVSVPVAVHAEAV